MMGTSSLSRTEWLAKNSRTLGILSVVALFIAGLTLIYARFFLGGADWVSGIGYVIFALFLFFVSLILGISASVTALIALKRNNGEDQTIKKMANLGLGLGLSCVVIILIFFAITWFFASNVPPPDVVTPISPVTAP